MDSVKVQIDTLMKVSSYFIRQLSRLKIYIRSDCIRYPEESGRTCFTFYNMRQLGYLTPELISL